MLLLEVGDRRGCGFKFEDGGIRVKLLVASITNPEAGICSRDGQQRTSRAGAVDDTSESALVDFTQEDPVILDPASRRPATLPVDAVILNEPTVSPLRGNEVFEHVAVIVSLTHGQLRSDRYSRLPSSPYHQVHRRGDSCKGQAWWFSSGFESKIEGRLGGDWRRAWPMDATHFVLRDALNRDLDPTDLIGRNLPRWGTDPRIKGRPRTGWSAWGMWQKWLSDCGTADKIWCRLLIG